MFRNGLPSLLGLAAIFLASSQLYNLYHDRTTRTGSAGSPPGKPYQRIPFLLVSAILVNILLHGVSSLKILLILYLNYRIPQTFGPSRMTPYYIWIFNIANLFALNLTQGFKFSIVLPALSALVGFFP